VAAHGQSERAKAMFAKLGELMEGRTPVRLHAAGQSEEVERPAALHESAPGFTPGISFFDSRLDLGVRAA